MTASRVDIEGWLRKLYEDDDLTHMIVACDTFDYENFPVYVKKDEDVRDVAKNYEGPNMTAIDEVYSNTYTFEDQMKERRAYHWD